MAPASLRPFCPLALLRSVSWDPPHEQGRVPPGHLPRRPGAEHDLRSPMGWDRQLYCLLGLRWWDRCDRWTCVVLIAIARVYQSRLPLFIIHFFPFLPSLLSPCLLARQLCLTHTTGPTTTTTNPSVCGSPLLLSLSLPPPNPTHLTHTNTPFQPTSPAHTPSSPRRDQHHINPPHPFHVPIALVTPDRT